MCQKCSLSIITVNYNGLADTCSLLDAITPCDHSTEVIVVDNASRNGEADTIEQRYPTVRVVKSPKNLGFAGGNNLGIKEAKGRFLFFVNNDTIYNPEELQWLVARLDNSPTTAIVCPKIRFFQGERKIQFAGYTPLSQITMRNRGIGYGEPDNGQYDIAHPTPYAHGAAMLVKREAIDKAGMMPECFFLYYEELDWSVMTRNNGYDIWYEPRCTVFHKESQATGADSPLKTYYLCRNRLLFARRNVKQPTLAATYAYLFCVAIKDIVKNTVRKRPDLAKATFKGLTDFIRI